MSSISTDLFESAPATLTNFVVTTSFAFDRKVPEAGPWVLSQARKTRVASSNLSRFDVVLRNSPESGFEVYLPVNSKLDLTSIKDSNQWLKALKSLYAASLLTALPVRDR